MAVSLTDIEKALAPKEEVDPQKLVPAEIYSEFSKLFSAKEAGKLAPHKPGVDHMIPLIKKEDGRKPDLPWGPLYSMSREELLVLRKTLLDLLDKFIEASSSPAAALFYWSKSQEEACVFVWIMGHLMRLRGRTDIRCRSSQRH